LGAFYGEIWMFLGEIWMFFWMFVEFKWRRNDVPFVPATALRMYALEN
jgi:hypothetical protein